LGSAAITSAGSAFSLLPPEVAECMYSRFGQVGPSSEQK
jgi:hypothetical protein